jgi:pantoate--beta-alanine ligase
MRTFETKQALRAWLDEARADEATIGVVPTMGYLHDGHMSLVRRSVRDCNITVVTIFVNPLQFAPEDDLEAYPRDLDSDRAACAAAGADVVFAPSVEEMYPRPIETTVSVAGVSGPLEGEHRPGHFDGVATVVTKLLSIAGPCRAYFGEKDWQQLAVIRRMASDLDIPATIVGCPIVREADGLAMSSRNVYLDAAQRRAAAVLNRALAAGIAAVEAGERDPVAVRGVVNSVLATEPLVESPDYVAVVDAATLREPAMLSGSVRLLVAARVGRARLIDNMGVELSGHS